MRDLLDVFSWAFVGVLFGFIFFELCEIAANRQRRRLANKDYRND